LPKPFKPISFIKVVSVNLSVINGRQENNLSWYPAFTKSLKLLFEHERM